MDTNLTTDRDSRTSHTVSRRRMLHVGCAGAAISLMPTGLIASAADDTAQQFDFGPQYSVLNVRKNTAGTQVQLGFRVNGRSFRMVLKSADGRVWRPV